MIGTAARLTYLLVEDFVKRQLIPLLQVLLLPADRVGLQGQHTLLALPQPLVQRSHRHTGGLGLPL